MSLSLKSEFYDLLPAFGFYIYQVSLSVCPGLLADASSFYAYPLRAHDVS